MPSTQDLFATHERLGRDFFASQDQRRAGPDPALVHASYTAEIGGNPPMDLAGHDGFARGFYAGFPDIMHSVDEVIPGERGVALRFTLRGTHTGDFFGIPATGRAVTIRANILLHTKEGRIARLQGIFDEAGLLRQLGVVGG